MRRGAVLMAVIGALAGAPALAGAQAPELRVIAAPQGVVEADSHGVCVGFDR